MKAQERLITSAPRPASESGTGSGATGTQNFSHAVQSVAKPGTRRIPASSIPTRARFLAVQPSAATIRRLTEASSRKSTLSAKSDVVNAILDRIVEALANGDRVELRGFGVLPTKTRAPRQARNPRTGA